MFLLTSTSGLTSAVALAALVTLPHLVAPTFAPPGAARHSGATPVVDDTLPKLAPAVADIEDHDSIRDAVDRAFPRLGPTIDPSTSLRIVGPDEAGDLEHFDEGVGDPRDGEPRVIALAAGGVDIEITVVRGPASVICGDGLRSYRFRVKNHGSITVDVPVTVTVGPNFGTTIVLVPAFGTAGGVVQVPTPMCSATCGPQTLSVLACSGYPDPTPSNDCASTTVLAYPLFWDLRFDIVNAPSSAHRCGNIDYDIVVTNVGTISSQNVCAITGVGLFSGAGNWASNLGIVNFTTPNIAPGGSWTFHVNNYPIPCGALLGTQYIKGEINYSAGCFDHCPAGNYDQQVITILP